MCEDRCCHFDLKLWLSKICPSLVFALRLSTCLLRLVFITLYNHVLLVYIISVLLCFFYIIVLFQFITVN